MASLAEVEQRFQSLLATAVNEAGLSSTTVGLKYPPEELLQKVGTDSGSIVAIIHKHTSYKSPGMTFTHSTEHVPPSIKSTLNSTSIAPGQTATLTLSFAPGNSVVNAEDLVGFGWKNGDLNNASTYSCQLGDTLPSIATALAAEIETQAGPFGIHAVASGAVISLSNTGTAGFTVGTAVGSITTLKRATKEAFRNFQICLWSADLDASELLEDTIEQTLLALDEQSCFKLSSGETIRFKLLGSLPGYGDTDKDAWGYVFMVSLEHFVDLTIKQWAVVAALPEQFE